MVALIGFRLLSGYYWAYALVIGWLHIVLPIWELFVWPGSFAIATVPFRILPAVMLLMLLLLVGRMLWAFVAGGYDLMIVLQLILILYAVVQLPFSIAFGRPSSESIVCVLWQVSLLVLGCFPIVQRTYAERVTPSRQQSNWYGRSFQQVITLGASSFVLLLGLWYGISVYTTHTMGAGEMLARVTGTADRNAIPQVMLTQLPAGTPDDAIMTWLEAKGVPRDQFVGGQFVRYQVQERSILALFSTPPWVIELFCSQTHYGMRFVLDADQRLVAVVMEHYGYCV
jgi:hypothetical protein